MISNNIVIEDKSYPKGVNTLIKDSKVLKVLMQSDLPLGLRNNKVQSSRLSVDIFISHTALKILAI